MKGVSTRVWLVTGAAALLGVGLLVAALLLDPADAVASTAPRAPRVMRSSPRRLNPRKPRTTRPLAARDPLTSKLRT